MECFIPVDGTLGNVMFQLKCTFKLHYSWAKLFYAEIYNLASCQLMACCNHLKDLLGQSGEHTKSSIPV